MAEGPVRIPTIADFSGNPRKNIFFITIKDNTQLTNYTKIGKINDWIRKKSDRYYIVRGMQGGIHFHVIAIVPEETNFNYIKGIHFHIENMTNTRLRVYDPSIADDNRNWSNFAGIITENNRKYQQQDLTESQQSLLEIICKSIHKRLLSIANKSKRRAARTKKEQDLQRILDYMQKNLLEPRELPITRYVDYIFQ